MTRRASPLAASGLVVLAGCVTMDPSVVDPAAYLVPAVNPAALYETGAPGRLVPVLDVRIQPMDRLVLVDFADDPVYDGVELQLIPDPDGEIHARVLLWRPDTVDVYDVPGRPVDVGAERASMEALLSPRAITFQHATFDYRLDVTPTGLDAMVRIRDRAGRMVEVEVIETRGEPVFGALIAPLGATSSAPDFLPLFFLDDFALVKRKGTEIRISVDGVARNPAKLPRVMKGPSSYLSRYSTRVVIAHWNERRNVRLETIEVPDGADRILADGIEWHVRWNGPRPEIEAAVARSGDDAIMFLFAPALPDLSALRPGARVDGRFVINVNDVPGVVAGVYAVERNGTWLLLEFHPQQAWQPPIVRGPSWVSSYRYRAEIDLERPAPRLRSDWSRTGPNVRRVADPVDASDDPVAGRTTHGVMPLPVVFYTPETEWAGGAAVIHTYRRGHDARPTVSTGSVIYTQNRQVSAEWNTQAYLAGGRWAVSGVARLVRFPDEFFGIGNATREEDRETYTDRSTRLTVGARRLVRTGLYVGGGFDLRGHSILDAEPGGLLASGAVTGSGGGRASGATLSISYDSRDNVVNPGRGAFHSASVARYGGVLGGDTEMTVATVDLRRYVPLGDRQVFGVQALLRSASGEVPFYMLPQLGGPDVMRGSYQGRFRDRHLLAGQAEYRVDVGRRIGLVAFAGAGQVASRLDAMSLTDLHYSVGGGLRFMIDRRERMNLRLDRGLGRGGAGTYISAGESF